MQKKNMQLLFNTKKFKFFHPFANQTPFYTYLLTSSDRYSPTCVQILLCNLQPGFRAAGRSHGAFISRQRPSSAPFPVTWALARLSLGHKDITLMNDRARTSPASPFDPLVGLIVCNARAMPHPTPAGPQAAVARPTGYRGQLFPYCWHRQPDSLHPT